MQSVQGVTASSAQFSCAESVPEQVSQYGPHTHQLPEYCTVSQTENCDVEHMRMRIQPNNDRPFPTILWTTVTVRGSAVLQVLYQTAEPHY